MTMWPEVESYRQREAEYERAVETFNELKARYEGALQANRDDPKLADVYRQLQDRQEELQSLYEDLQRLRRGLAAATPI
jgi:DNA repair exonuclease SbcCD ATPase subunit